MKSYDFKDYVSISRWSAYYQQISPILDLRPKRLLEVGLGSKVLYGLLKTMGMDITGFDNNKELGPDVMGDINDINKHFADLQFDCVCCFQVLEHIPYPKLEKTLSALSKITSRYLLISLPYAGYTAGLEFRLHKSGERIFSFVYRLPRFWEKHVYNGQHHWEVGKRGYGIGKVRGDILKYFAIREMKFLKPNKAMVMFVLEKRCDDS